MTPGMRVLLAAALAVVVIAGLKAAAPMVNFILISIFLAVVAAGPVAALERRGIPGFLAVALVIAILITVAAILAMLLAGSLVRFSSELPVYQRQLEDNLAPLMDWLSQRGVEFDRPTMFPALDPNNIFGLVVALLGSAGNLLSNTLLILVAVVFMMFDRNAFVQRLQALAHDPLIASDRYRELVDGLREYLAIKTWTSLATGLIIALWCYASGLDFPIIWGLLAFAFNYVPNIGSILAAIPAVLLALVDGGFGLAALIALGYLLVNGLIGNVVEPRLMGRGAGLYTSVVFISLVFWGWVLGAVGMILAVPLTMTLKLTLASSQDTLWIASLLGGHDPLIDKTVTDEPLERDHA